MLPFLINILATWRLSSLVSREDGAYLIFQRFRNILGSVELKPNSRPIYSNQAIAAVSCMWCISVWIAFVIAKGNVKKALAYSAGALVIEKWINP